MSLPGRTRGLEMLSALALVCAPLACDEEEPTGPPPDGTAAAELDRGWTLATLPDEEIQEDEILLSVAREVPSFGGFYYDSERPSELVVALTDPGDLGLAESRIRAALAEPKANESPLEGKTVVGRTVEHSFLQLARFRTVLRQKVFSIAGVTTLGVDESQNKVWIGVTDRAAEQAVQDLLAALEIPSNAVHIGRAGYTQIQTDLDDAMGYTHGGWLIETPNPCSLGPVGRRASDSLPVFTTASHCTSQYGVLNEDTVYQPTDAGSVIGIEIDDPALTAPAGCPTSNYCRDSDAALMEAFSPPFDDSKSYRIARPDDSTNCENCTGPRTIDASQPFLVVMSQGNHNTQGEVLHKIGQTTGWTFGVVNQTCMDELGLGPWVRLCSDFVDYSSSTSDSGAPVFKDLGYKLYGEYPAVQLRGVHWGKKEVDDTFSAVMSDLYQVQQDLGSLILSLYWYVGLVVEIDGPSEVDQNLECVWEVDVDGGDSPYTYAWVIENDTVGTSATYAGETGEDDFTLTVTVRDKYGFDKSDITR